MVRRPPSSTRTDTLFPHTTLFRSTGGNSDDLAITHLVRRTHQPLDRAGLLLECREFAQLHEREPLDEAMPHAGGGLVAHARFGKGRADAELRIPERAKPEHRSQAYQSQERLHHTEHEDLSRSGTC